jgi:hypothetical protein
LLISPVKKQALHCEELEHGMNCSGHFACYDTGTKPAYCFQQMAQLNCLSSFSSEAALEAGPMILLFEFSYTLKLQ